MESTPVTLSPCRTGTNMSERDMRLVSPNGIQPSSMSGGEVRRMSSAPSRITRASMGLGGLAVYAGGTSTGGPSNESMVSTAWIWLVSGEYRSTMHASHPSSSWATPTITRAASSGVRAAPSRRLTSKNAARVRSAPGCSAGSQPLAMVLPFRVLHLGRWCGVEAEAVHAAAVHLHHLE